MNQVIIGKFIAQLRHEHQLTQETIGQRIGVSNKTISRWENGNYMPDIEMLQILSKEFNVSINELLCGKKLNENNFKKSAEENIVAILKDNPFSRKEKYDFWMRKWIKEHLVLILFSFIIVIAVSIAAHIAFGSWIIGFCPLALVILYAVLRNRMMAYVEDRIYGE